METHRLKKCLKLGILLLIVPSLFWKCQEKDDLDNIQLQSKNESYKIVSLDDLPKLKPIINNIKGFGHNGSVLLRGGETFMGIDHVLVDEIIQVTKEEASTYTLGIDTDFKNSKYIENLHIIEVENGYIAYIMRYVPIAGWEDDNFNRTPEGDLVFNPANFNGDITKYSLEREIIWTTKPVENTQARTITTCTYSVVRYCTNDGYGGTNGDPHVCGPKCTGPFYSEVEYTCTYGFTGGGGNYDDHIGGGSSENENEGCVEIAGTLIQDSQPLSGISTGCATNIDTGIKQPVNEEADCKKLKRNISDVPLIHTRLHTMMVDSEFTESGLRVDIHPTTGVYTPTPVLTDNNGEAHIKIPVNPFTVVIAHTHPDSDDGYFAMFSSPDIIKMGEIIKYVQSGLNPVVNPIDITHILIADGRTFAIRFDDAASVQTLLDIYEDSKKQKDFIDDLEDAYYSDNSGLPLYQSTTTIAKQQEHLYSLFSKYSLNMSLYEANYDSNGFINDWQKINKETLEKEPCN